MKNILKSFFQKKKRKRSGEKNKSGLSGVKEKRKWKRIRINQNRKKRKRKTKRKSKKGKWKSMKKTKKWKNNENDEKWWTMKKWRNFDSHAKSSTISRFTVVVVTFFRRDHRRFPWFCFRVCLFPEENQQPFLGGSAFAWRKVIIFSGSETKHTFSQKILTNYFWLRSASASYKNHSFRMNNQQQQHNLERPPS